LKEIHDSLTGVVKLVNLDKQFEKALAVADYPKAIEAVLECRNSINQYKHYTAIQELATTLQVRREISIRD
jgi:hypothetical protein